MTAAVTSEFDIDTVDRLLTTTRSVRKRLDLDRPVSRATIEQCLRIALQAASGSNAQRWRWIVVTDGARRRAIGELYSTAFRGYLAEGYGAQTGEAAAKSPASRLAAQERLMDSVRFLIDHIAEVPVHIIVCVVGRITPESPASWVSGQFGSVYPAVWNLHLALRSRGLATCLTTAHLEYEREAAEILRIPFAELTQVCLLPVAHYTGVGFKPAERKPFGDVVFWEEFDPATLAGHAV